MPDASLVEAKSVDHKSIDTKSIDTKSIDTKSIHVGEIVDQFGSPHTPLYNSTTFKFKSTEDLLDVVDGRKHGALYTRYGLNPTIFSIEEKLAALENAEASWAFSSGMAPPKPLCSLLMVAKALFASETLMVARLSY